MSYLKRLYFLASFVALACGHEMDIPLATLDQAMIVYRNSGNVVHFVDPQKYELIKTITIPVPDSLQVHRLCLSTNRDFMIFTASAVYATSRQYIVVFNIDRGKIMNHFATGLSKLAAPRMGAANMNNRPGLFYFYTHNSGLYEIDFMEQTVTFISPPDGDRDFKCSKDKKYIIILKQFPDYRSYAEIEVNKANDGLTKPPVVTLNKNDVDSIFVSDAAISENHKELFVSVDLSKRRSRGIADYFGSYDLTTKAFYLAPITLPWSINPYYMAYSDARKEVYLVGRNEVFYIIDVSSKDYRIAGAITLTGKIPGPSLITLNSDQNTAFVSAAYTNLIYVLDLNRRKISATINVEQPYLMLFR